MMHADKKLFLWDGEKVNLKLVVDACLRIG